MGLVEFRFEDVSTVLPLHELLSSSLCAQLNKIIDENSTLRNSLARSPTVPPMSPSSPPMSPPAIVQIEEEGSGEGEGSGVVPLYAEVDKSKVRSHLRLSVHL